MKMNVTHENKHNDGVIEFINRLSIMVPNKTTYQAHIKPALAL